MPTRRAEARQVQDDTEDPAFRQAVDGRPEILRKTQSRHEDGT
jgi:hypothetical protein